MKNETRFAIAFGILLIVYICFFVYTYYMDSKVLQVASINTDKFEIQSIITNENNYTVQAYYPVTKNEYINKYILFNIQNHIREFKIQAINLEKNNIKSSLRINFDIKESTNYLNYVFNIKKDLGVFNPENLIFTVNIDKQKQELIRLEDLNIMYNNYLINVSNYCFQKLTKNPDIQKYNAMIMLELGTKAIKENYEDYIIDEDNITILFEQAKVAPYALEKFSVDIPKEYFLNK